MDRLAGIEDQPEPIRRSSRPGGISLRRVARQSVHPGVPEAAVAPGEVDAYLAGSASAESLRSGRPVL
ncbi:hypothetical protein SAMN04487983_1002395 [Streptomyces sp. yr375]|nr:hypothetical protein SAMN04487983_1002395 [Streptomyces sp. yr375]